MDRVDYQSLIIQDILNLESAGELNLRPWYQRRSVWISNQQSYLINTLFERKPIPALYIRHSLDLEKGISVKEVVDGQQRTRAIIDFYNSKFAARHPDHSKAVKFLELTKTQREKFLLTALPVGYLLGASDADVIDIFARINSVAKTLNAQEKRNALYSGEFKQFCVGQAVKRTEFWRTNKIFSDNDIARMGEVQFISDLVVNLLDGLSDFSAPKINDAYKKFDFDFPRQEEVGKRLDKVFDFLGKLEPTSLISTIFNRQPLFFSLFIVLDSLQNLSKQKVADGLYEMDARFNTDDNFDRKDLEFFGASSASTQRISQRKIRDNYIRSFIK